MKNLDEFINHPPLGAGRQAPPRITDRQRVRGAEAKDPRKLEFGSDRRVDAPELTALADESLPVSLEAKVRTPVETELRKNGSPMLLPRATGAG